MCSLPASPGQDGVSEAGLKAHQDMTYYLSTFIEHVSLCATSNRSAH